jgi:hypothetical protein
MKQLLLQLPQRRHNKLLRSFALKSKRIREMSRATKILLCCGLLRL